MRTTIYNILISALDFTLQPNTYSISVIWYIFKWNNNNNRMWFYPSGIYWILKSKQLWIKMKPGCWRKGLTNKLKCMSLQRQTINYAPLDHEFVWFFLWRVYDILAQKSAGTVISSLFSHACPHLVTSHKDQLRVLTFYWDKQ